MLASIRRTQMRRERVRSNTRDAGRARLRRSRRSMRMRIAVDVRGCALVWRGVVMMCVVARSVEVVWAGCVGVPAVAV
jgi:hypothetical protein